MKVDNVSLQNRLYAVTVVVMLILLSAQFTLLRWTDNLPVKELDQFPTVANKRAPSKTAIPLNGNRFYRPEDYPFLTRLKSKQCSTLNQPFIIIFVASAPGHRDRRDAIRSTWGSLAELEEVSASLIFLLGKSKEKENPSMASGISQEIDKFGDILQIDFVDSYLNLTLKSISAIRWTMEYCQGVKYLMKTDDDIYVNVTNLINFLEEQREAPKIYGCIKSHAFGQPLKLQQDGLMTKDHAFVGGHPPFAAGAGYVISGTLLNHLYKATMTLPLFPIEDVFVTGRCGQSIGHPPSHDGRFTCGEALNQDCEMASRFTGHWVKPDRQRIIYSKLKNDQCSLRVQNK